MIDRCVECGREIPEWAKGITYRCPCGTFLLGTHDPPLPTSYPLPVPPPVPVMETAELSGGPLDGGNTEVGSDWTGLQIVHEGKCLFYRDSGRRNEKGYRIFEHAGPFPTMQIVREEEGDGTEDERGKLLSGESGPVWEFDEGGEG